MLDVPRLYATGLGNVSVFWHEVTYIWQCCFFVHLSRHCFMLDVPRLYATGLGNVSVFWHEVTYIWQCCFFVHLSRHCFMLDVPRLYATGLGNVSVFDMKLPTFGNAISLYIWTTKYKSFIVCEKVCSCFQGGMTRTSIYVRSYIVCFKCFLLVGVCYISYEDFQTKSL
jgi:hypothetical protein